jgi:hypothetical protein
MSNRNEALMSGHVRLLRLTMKKTEGKQKRQKTGKKGKKAFCPSCPFFAFFVSLCYSRKAAYF